MSKRKSLFLLMSALALWTQCSDHEYLFCNDAVFSRHRLDFSSPIARWDEAIPLGNGHMGALIWGDGKPLKISLDRADLWDTRPVTEFDSPDYNYPTMRQWVRDGRIEDLHRLYERPYDQNAGPTKIPAGRIEIDLSENDIVASSRLSLKDAVATVTTQNNHALMILQHATEPVGILLHTGPHLPHVRLVAPAFGGNTDSIRNYHSLDSGDLARLNYPPPQVHEGNTTRSFEQQGWGGFRFAVALAWSDKSGQWCLAWSIASSHETENPLQLAEERAAKALQNGFKRLLKSHSKWWASYWNRSRIEVPNPVVERQWYLDTYKFGAASRRGAPPITLQAIWTADEGKIPPWKGDYHHDLNTQLSYWPCYSGNHLEEGLSYLDWLWKVIPEAQRYTEKFFQKPGFNVPMTSDIEGKQMGGWHQYTHSATISAWLAQHFYLHWRYSMDRTFLKERAYPYLKQAAIFLEAIAEKDKQGMRYLPLSSSPEIYDNRLEAWLPPTSNYDLALMRWLFAATAELARELNLPDEEQHWSGVLSEFPNLSLDPLDRRLLVAPGLSLPFSHRHFSHLMAIHPLGLVTWEGEPPSQTIIKNSLSELERLGSDWWCGYSYAWLASLYARAKESEKAERALQIFSQAFCSPNSFHLNGDQTRSGYSKFTYRPFTLEGNMAAAAGLQEMLLQSYHGVLRIFPAVPLQWREAAFYRLRAEGAFLVSAKKSAGKIELVTIESEKGGDLLLENPFPENAFKLKLKRAKAIATDGPMLRFHCQPGGLIQMKCL